MCAYIYIYIYMAFLSTGAVNAGANLVKFGDVDPGHVFVIELHSLPFICYWCLFPRMRLGADGSRNLSGAHRQSRGGRCP